MIEIKNVIKHYTMGDELVKALDNVSITIKDNEFVSIVGPSGSGKSTLMNILGCLDIPDKGEYIFGGVNVEKCKENALAEIRNKKVGFVFQNFNLLSKLSALENVEVPLLYRGISAKEAREQAMKYLKKVGLEGREKHRPNQLSGGQQQRVAIARALAGEPEIILADEPTGALDSKTSAEVMEMLKEIHKGGQTIILITHDNGIAEQAERVVKIIDGKIYEERR